jgi:hypothetical protein
MLFTSARLNQTHLENQTAAQHPRAARAELEQVSTFQNPVSLKAGMRNR